MPVFTWEKYKKNLSENGGFDNYQAQQLQLLFKGKLSESLNQNPAYKTISEKFLQYSNALHDLIRPLSGGQEQVREIRSSALATFDNLKEFLETTEPGNEKSNYEMIRDVLSKEDFEFFLQGLASLNEKLGTGINKEMLEPQQMQEEDDLNVSKEINMSAFNGANQPGQPAQNAAVEPVNIKVNAAAQDINFKYQTAAEYIEKIRDLKYEKNDEGEYDFDQIKDRFLKIMAARMLADSVRGKRDRLDSKLITEEDVNKKAAELKNKALMNDFLEKLKGNPELMEKAVSAAKKGHGGGLDDLFKDYIKNLPAAGFKNQKGLERFMPSGLVRIDVLKEKAKELIEKEKDLSEKSSEYQHILDINQDLKNSKGYKEYEDKLKSTKSDLANLSLEKRKIMLEITEIRNVMQAGKGKKSLLDKPIPTADVRIDETLRDSVRAKYTKEQEDFFNAHFLDCLEGHGGQMIENLRNDLKEKGPDFLRADDVNIITKNTITTRLFALTEEAAELVGKFDAVCFDGDADLDILDDDNSEYDEDEEFDLDALGLAGLDFQNMDYDDPEVQELFGSIGLKAEDFKGKSDKEIRQVFKNLVQDAQNEDREDKKKAKEDAKEIKESLAEGMDEFLKEHPEKRPIIEEYMELGKKIIAEYLLFGGMATNPETKEIDEKNLYKEIPWKVVNQIRTDGPNANPEFRSYSDLIAPGKMYDMLRTVANIENCKGPTIVADKLIDIKYQHDKALNPAVMKPKTSLTVKVHIDTIVNSHHTGEEGKNVAHGPKMS